MTWDWLVQRTGKYCSIRRMEYPEFQTRIFGRMESAPTFLFRNKFYLQLSPHCPKMNKKSTGEVKKNSRFLSTGHGILPSCGTSPVDLIRLISPLQPYLAEKISIQSSNCNILGLAAIVAFFANKARFTQI